MKVGIIGAGAMGSGIAQVVSTAGHQVIIFDTKQEALDLSKQKLKKILARLVEKEKINQSFDSSIAYLSTLGCRATPPHPLALSLVKLRHKTTT